MEVRRHLVYFVVTSTPLNDDYVVPPEHAPTCCPAAQNFLLLISLVHILYQLQFAILEYAADKTSSTKGKKPFPTTNC